MNIEDKGFKRISGERMTVTYWPTEEGEPQGDVEVHFGITRDDGWMTTDEAVDLRDMLNEIIIHANMVENNEKAGN